MAKPRRLRLNPQSYPKSVRDRVEVDYAHKLSGDQRQWLAAFNEAEYGSNPACLQIITGKYIKVEERRRLMREIKRYQRDILSAGLWIDVDQLVERHYSIEDLLIGAIDNSVKIERIFMEMLKQAILFKNWGRHGKA